MLRIFDRRQVVLSVLALLVLNSVGLANVYDETSEITQDKAVEKVSDGLIVSLYAGYLKIEVCTADVVRVAFSKDKSFFTRPSLAAAPKKCEPVKWDLTNGPQTATLSTAALKVRVNLSSGAVSFLDPNGRQILAEQQGGRSVTPAEVQGEKTFHVRQVWEPNNGESLYGLGEQQLGLMDIKGYDLDLWQHNGTIAVPFLVSSRGYGILWDNPSYTRFGDLREFEPPPATALFDKSDKPGGLTATYFTGANFEKQVAVRTDSQINIGLPNGVEHPNKKIHPDFPDGDVSIRWEGAIEPTESGDYTFQTFSNSGVKVWIDNKLVINHWRQGWLPWLDEAQLPFVAKHRYPIRVEWSKDQQGLETMQLKWKTPSASKATSLWSDVGDGTDYYFVYGPDLDQVVAGYRTITGDAPMMPKWIFGLWQSRQRYKTSQESLDVLNEFRSRKIPVDNIVQDWFYWKEDQWGSHEFDKQRFPDPDAWVRDIHDKYHAHVMISVWPKYYTGVTNFNQMQSRGFLYQANLTEKIHDWVGYQDTFYDAFNPAARSDYWNQVNKALFKKGFDGWWLDASEPDLTPTPTLDGQKIHMNPTALGTGSRVLNAYPLVHSAGVYEGQIEAAPDQRVFILTRSAYAGQQHYGAAVWSGDTSSTWTALRKQVYAGLGFSLSGIPYWSMDSGGFSVPARFGRDNPSPEDVAEWRELNTRWFQFGTFVPLLRVHGESPNREMWFFGGESDPAFQTMLKFDRLRYRMLPYIYSLAGKVTSEGSTIMRPLVMDFRSDAKAREIGDEYMFGPAFLVAPVTEFKARSRSVYLPENSIWYDFWTGKSYRGGESIDAPAAFDSMPVFVRSGSIIPFGPDLQYAAEKPADPLTIYVYSGADGKFTLYEDDGLTNAYQKGASSRIDFSWDDSAKTLTINKREGSYPGMLERRTINAVLVSKSDQVGYGLKEAATHSVQYTGERATIKF